MLVIGKSLKVAGLLLESARNDDPITTLSFVADLD